MIKGVLFDLDSTLLDEERARDLAIEAFYRSVSNKGNLDYPDIISRWVDGISIFYPLYVKGTISFEEQRRKRLQHFLEDESLNNEELDEYFKSYLITYRQNWMLFNDVIPTLEMLAGYKVGIITNGNSLQQREKIHHLGIERYFDSITISQELGIGKPEAKIFHQGCIQIGLMPRECIYIGDKLEDDAIASTKIGMKGIWLNRKLEKNEQNTDIHVFSSLLNLRDYLLANNL